MSSKNNWLSLLPIRLNEFLLLIAIVFVVILAGTLDSNHGYFNKPEDSAIEIARMGSFLGIFALGAAVVIISGGIDLSVGSTIAFSATICGSVLLIGHEAVDGLREAESSWADFAECFIVPAAITASILTGLMIGTLHAWLISAIRLPPFIATLATLVGLRSLARIICDGVTAPRNLSRSQINLSDPFFSEYINDGIKLQVWVFVVLALVTWFILSRTILGRHIYALGGNEQATRLSGIRSENVKWFAYCFGSLTASIAGVFVAGNELVAAPVNQGRGYELNAIAAAVVGGCSLQGGLGTVFGTVLGCFFLRIVIDSVARIIKTGADMYEGLIVGAVVVAAVTFSQIQKMWSSGQELFPGKLGVVSVLALSAFVWCYSASSSGVLTGFQLAGGTLVILSIIKVLEVVRARRARRV